MATSVTLHEETKTLGYALKRRATGGREPSEKRWAVFRLDSNTLVVDQTGDGAWDTFAAAFPDDDARLGLFMLDMGEASPEATVVVSWAPMPACGIRAKMTYSRAKQPLDGELGLDGAVHVEAGNRGALDLEAITKEAVAKRR